MKKRKLMVLAVLASLTLGTQTADAQIFQCRQTHCVCYRAQSLGSQYAGGYRLEIDAVYAADSSGRLVGRPSQYALTAPATNGSGYFTIRAASADKTRLRRAVARWRPSLYALTAPATNGSGYFTIRAASADKTRLRRATTCNGSTCGAEYVPTVEGNVPAHEYLEAKKNGGAPIATTFMAAANRIRARYGLPTLTLDANLCDGSARQANYCASVGALIHGAGVAEILAMNSSGFDSALNQWLASPAHRAILLSGQYRVAGVAVVRDRNGRVWCAMRFR